MKFMATGEARSAVASEELYKGKKNMNEDFLESSIKIDSFQDMQVWDEALEIKIKKFQGNMSDRKGSVEAVKEKILVLFNAAPTVARLVENADEYDAIEEMVNRWTGYLTYYRIPTPVVPLPAAP